MIFLYQYISSKNIEANKHTHKNSSFHRNIIYITTINVNYLPKST